MAQAAQMEELVHQLNDTRNQAAPGIIDTIQKQIQRLQRERIAWQWGMELLNHHEAVMRFYGALTLTIKINADWDVDKVGEDRELVNQLLERLVSSYVRLASIPDVSFVLQKLCTTLVAVFQKPQSAWALPIRHLTACMVANQYISQDMVPDLTVSLGSDRSIFGAQLKALLMFPLTLAEQDSAISGAVKEANVRVRTSNNILDILKLLHFTANSLAGNSRDTTSAVLRTYTLSVNYDQAQYLDTARFMLQLIPHWTVNIQAKGPQQGNLVPESKFDYFEATIRSFPTLFQQDALAPVVLQAFTALEESSHKILQKALPGYEGHIINSPQAASWMKQLVSGDFDPDAITYVNFLEACMGQVDVTTPDYLSSGSYIEILKQIRRLLQCEGAPGVDDEVCQVALEILTSVSEGFGDWPEPSPYDESMKTLVKDTCDSTLKKMRIPLDELNVNTQTWDADDRAKFQDFRYDVQDYLQNAFSILGDSLIEGITKSTVNTKSTPDWSLFEAGLFAFVAFSDTVSNEAEKYDIFVTAIFDCAKWRMAIEAEADVPDRVRQIMIKMVSENTGFLQRHTHFLVPSLNFLFTALHIETSATSASRAIYTLCDAQRSMLTEALPHFMGSLVNTAGIEADARHRIYAAVGAIIQALPNEMAKVQPLTQIMQELISKDIENEIAAFTNQEDLVAKLIDILQTLSTLGRGLRAPSDTPIDLDKQRNTDSQFWTLGPGQMTQQQILNAYKLLTRYSRDQNNPSFIEAACSFLRTGFTEEHPSPFKFPNSKILELLSDYIRLDCSQPDQVMSTASSYLASVQPTDADHDFHTLVMLSIRRVNDTYVNHKTLGQPLNSDFCAASLDFYGRLLPKWASVLFELPEALDIVGLAIETALVLIEDPDTLPRRTAASFLTAVLDATGQSKIVSNDVTASKASNLLQNFAPRIIGSTLRLLGGVCARSDIDALAETIKKAVQKQPLMANKLLKEAVRDENQVLAPRTLQATKPEQRARFASQVELLRGSRKTNDVIREFWIASRGREFDYVT